MSDNARSQGAAQGDRDFLEPDARGGRWLRRQLASPVTIITTTEGDGYRGTTVTASAVLSVEPLCVLVSIEIDSQMDEALASSGVFALNILPWTEQFLADQFAGFTPRPSRTFERIPHTRGSTGAPLLQSALAWADCRVTQTLEVGDHRCYIGAVLALGAGENDNGNPLLYYLNRFRRLHP